MVGKNSMTKLVKSASRTMLIPIKVLGFRRQFGSFWHKLKLSAIVALLAVAFVTALLCFSVLVFQLLVGAQSCLWQKFMVEIIKASIPKQTEETRVRILLHPQLDCNRVRDAVVFVVSRVGSFDKRSFVRESWGKELKNIYAVPVVFVVGRSLSAAHEMSVVNESRKHGDILFADMEDTYQNLTLKHLALLQFASVCKGPKFFYSVDDDYLVVPRNLLMFLYTRAKHKQNTIYGNCIQNCSLVQRDGRHKNFMPWTTYSFDVYPPYCKGSGRIITQDVPAKLLSAIPNLQWLKDFGRVEDVAFLGLLPLKTGVKQININPLISSHWDRKKCEPNNQLCSDMDIIQIGDFEYIERMKSTWHYVSGAEPGQKLLNIKFV